MRCIMRWFFIRLALILVLTALLIHEILGQRKGKEVKSSAAPAAASDAGAVAAPIPDKEVLGDPLDEYVRIESIERARLQEEYLAAADLVVKLTNNAEARSGRDLLRANVMTYVPVYDDKLRTIQEVGKKKHPIAMFMVVERDLQKFTDLRQQRDDEHQYAGYFNNTRPIPVLKVFCDPMTDFWRGLIILHEASHAQFYLRHPKLREFKVKAELASEEVRVYEFNARLLNKVGGKKYAAMLRAEVNRIRQVEKVHYIAPREIQIVLAGEYNPAFDDIFGPAKSEREKQLRQSTLNLQANFIMIEQRFGKYGRQDVESVKAQWYVDTRLDAKEN